jgi:hypothetical protein
MQLIKRFLFIVIFCLLICEDAYASKIISCINRPTGETCTVSLQSIAANGTATTVFTDAATTAHADPGGHGKASYDYVYASDLDPTLEYRVYCNCTADSVYYIAWSYVWEPYETRVDAAVTSRSTYAGGAVASVTAAVTVGTNNDKTGYALTAAYDAAKTAASQSSVNAIPTNPTLQTTWTDTKAGYLDAAISSRSTLTAQQVWEYVTRTLTASGGLTAQQVWEYATRELTGKTGFALVSDYDAAKTCTQTEPDNANISVIKDIVDKFVFDVNNYVKSIPQGGVVDTVRHK